MKAWSLTEILLCLISSSLCWALSPNCTFKSCPVCLSDRKQKAIVTEGPDGKAYTSAFRIGRNEQFWDSQSLASTVVGILIAERLGIAIEYVPAHDVTTAMLSMSNCENWMNGECRRILMDSASSELAANAFASGSKLYKDPLPDIMFHSEVLGWAGKEQTYPMIDWAKTHLATSGSIGFHSTDHLYVFRTLAEEALKDTGIALDYWRSYTTRSVLPYFESPRELMAAGIIAETQGCSSSDKVVQAGMDIHTELGYTCTQESWWLTPSCAEMGDDWKDACIPVLDDNWGFVKRQLYEKMALSGMKLAKITVGYDLQYELILSSKHKALFNWWDTDTTFLEKQPIIVNLPESVTGGDPLNKVLHEPSLAANEQLKVFLNTLTISNDKLTEMLYPAALARTAQLFDHDSQMFQKVACDWLRANPELVSSWLPDFRVCPPGHAFDDSASKCKLCPSGTYSARSKTSPVLECVPCPRGHFCSEGSISPTLCPRGSYAKASGHSECTRCLLARYADTAGATECKSCQGITAGSTTLFPAAASKDDCVCPEQTYHRQDSGCTRCEEGLDCPGGLGAPLQAEGYYGMTLPEYGMDGQEWFFIFKCHADARRCPRARLGLCASGRKGLACAECQDGLTPLDDGTCGKCEGSSQAFFVLASMGVASAILFSYFLLDKDTIAKLSHSILLVGIVGSACLNFLQQLGTIGTTRVEWPNPALSMLDFMRVFSFDIEVLSAGCMISLTPMWMYVLKLCIALIMLGLVLLVHVAVVLLRHRGRFRDRLPTLIRSVGSLLLVFQIAIVNVSVPPFECKAHPNRLHTVAQYPTIVCGWEDGGQEWQIMVVIGICSTLLVCAWVSGCLFVIYRLPKQIKESNEFYMRSFTFLFTRFKPDDYWFSAFLICRNLVVALAPLLPDSTSQLLCLQGIQVLYLLAAVRFMPWRINLANYVDCMVTVVLLAFFSCAAFLVKTPNTETMAWICSILVILMFALNALILSFDNFPVLLRRFRKPFSFLICHHKAGTGAFARLLKLHLEEFNSQSLRHQHQKVFVDSDEPQNLGLILDYIASQSDHIVVLMSKELLLRPWCIAELVAAHLQLPRLKMLPVFWPDFSRPDDVYISKYALRVDCSSLLSHGITATMVQSMLKWLREVPGLSLPSMVTRHVVTGIAASIVDGSVVQEADFGANSLSSNQSQTSRVVAIADRTNTESVATALILCRMIAPLTAQDPSCAPRYLDENEDFPDVVETCIFVLSDGAFFEPSFVRHIIQAAGLQAMVLPIIAHDGFRFPGKAFLAQYEQRASAMLTPHGILEDPKILANLIESLCEEVAIVFAPQGYLSTEELLRMKARAVFDRLVRRQLPRLASDNNSISESIVPVGRCCSRVSDTATDSFVPDELTPTASSGKAVSREQLFGASPSSGRRVSRELLLGASQGRYASGEQVLDSPVPEAKFEGAASPASAIRIKVLDSPVPEAKFECVDSPASGRQIKVECFSVASDDEFTEVTRI